MLKYDTCAHALPRLPPLLGADDQKLYRVAKFCRSASVREGVYILDGDVAVCQTCPMHTDPHKVIYIRNDYFRADIFLDRLADLPVQNIRKLFTLMLLAAWENEAAITALDDYLEDAIPDSKKAWDEASAAYQHGWHKVSNPKKRDRITLEVIQTNNRLTAALKWAKSQYERWVKIQALWKDIKHKMNVK